MVVILGEFASHDPKPLPIGNPPDKMPPFAEIITVDGRNSAPPVIHEAPYEHLDII